MTIKTITMTTKTAKIAPIISPTIGPILSLLLLLVEDSVDKDEEGVTIVWKEESWNSMTSSM